MIQIPTFNPGDRVIYHEKPVEFECPVCHIGYAERIEPQDHRATVVGLREGNLTCLGCGAKFPCPEGWYRIDIDGDGFPIAVPYTLLERELP